MSENQDKFGLATLPPSDVARNQEFDKIVASAWLPRLELKGSNSDAVKEELVPVGYALVTSKTNMKGLGKTINIVPIEFRYKAVRICKDGAILTSYDPKSEKFRAIMAESDIKDSGCMYGPEFLVAIQDVGIATLHCNSKSHRLVAPQIKDRLRKGATLGVDLAENAKGKWNVITVKDFGGQFEIDIQKVTDELPKFLNPKEDGVEVAKPVESSRER